MVSDEKLLYFCRNFSAAIGSGVAIGDSLETLSRGGDVTAEAAKTAAEGISVGRPLHESLAAEGAFPPVFIALVRAGEEAGKLDEFLERFADCLEARIDFRRRMKRALLYPLFVVALAVALLALFVVKGLPLLLEPLEDAGLPPPASLARLMALADALARNWQEALVYGASALLLLVAFAGCAAGRRLAAAAAHWLPGLRFASEHSRQDLLLTTTALLLESGLPATQAFDVLGQLFDDDPILRRRLTKAASQALSGSGFAASLAPMLGLDDRRALENAEKAGRMAPICRILAKSHRDAQQHRLGLIVTGSKIAASFAIVALVGGLIWTALQPALGMLNNLPALIRQAAAP